MLEEVLSLKHSDLRVSHIYLYNEAWLEKVPGKVPETVSEEVPVISL